MNCEAAGELLSAYYDRELARDQAAAVATHLETCNACSRELAQFAALSRLASTLRQPAAPAGTWASIDASLQTERQRALPSGPSRRRLGTLALATGCLLAAAVALMVSWNWNPGGDDRAMATVFDQYLEWRHTKPDEAQNLLVTHYGGKLVSPQEAVTLVNFKPNAPDELPHGFSRRGLYVLKTPDCTCTQAVYADHEGNTLAVFERSKEQKGWWGGCAGPSGTCCCRGEQGCLMRTGGEMAADCQCGPRRLTIVGGRDTAQITELLAYLDAQHGGQDAEHDHH